MTLHLKQLKASGRSAWIYYPDMPVHSEKKVCSITVVRPEATEESVNRLLQNGLQQLADREHLILCFPNPEKDGWHWKKGSERDSDIQHICTFQGEMNRPDDSPVTVNEKGIPTYDFMMNTWHPMNDTQYFIGLDSGASMLASMAAIRPQNMAAVLLIGGESDKETISEAVLSPVPAWLCGCKKELQDFFAKANGISWNNETEAGSEKKTYMNSVNPACKVILDSDRETLDPEFLKDVWKNFFSKTRRMNTSVYGDCADRTDLTDPGFEWFIDDMRIDSKPHTWLVHTPTEVRRGKLSRVPVVFFYHGGSDNPSEAAEMSRFHEIGEKEGFITVYPWGTNHAGWNMELLPEEEDDLAYCKALIEYMLEHYPIDPQRVYLSGFSNGAGMAQTIAMIYPEMIAALGHIDSNWPGVRIGRCDVDISTVEPMRIALEKKKEHDLFMPVWYTYGTREASSPICKGCSQQHQYDFWKCFNHIEIKETRELEDPNGPEHGVDGDESYILKPDPRYPAHYYTVQTFFTADAEKNDYYHFALMHDKAHEVAPKDAQLAWDYMKQFRRKEDGTVELTVASL